MVTVPLYGLQPSRAEASDELVIVTSPEQTLVCAVKCVSIVENDRKIDLPKALLAKANAGRTVLASIMNVIWYTTTVTARVLSAFEVRVASHACCWKKQVKADTRSLMMMMRFAGRDELVAAAHQERRCWVAGWYANPKLTWNVVLKWSFNSCHSRHGDLLVCSTKVANA